MSTVSSPYANIIPACTASSSSMASSSAATTSTTIVQAATSSSSIDDDPNSYHDAYYNLPPPPPSTEAVFSTMRRCGGGVGCADNATTTSLSLVTHPPSSRRASGVVSFDDDNAVLVEASGDGGEQVVPAYHHQLAYITDASTTPETLPRNDAVVITKSNSDGRIVMERVFEVVYTWKLVEEHGNVFQLDQMGILDRQWPVDEVYKLMNIRNEWKSISARNRLLYERSRKRLQHHLLFTRDSFLDIPYIFYRIRQQLFSPDQRNDIDLSPFLHHICFFIDVVNRDRAYFEIMNRLTGIQFYNMQQRSRQRHHRSSIPNIFRAFLGFMF